MTAYNQKDLEKWKNSLLNNQANESSSNCNLPLGLIMLKYRFQSNFTLTVDIIKSKLEIYFCISFLSVEEIIWSAPISKIG